jgi:NADH-quinone oxidoreductase subunit J
MNVIQALGVIVGLHSAIGVALALVAILAALAAVFAREVLRLALGLGVLFMAVAGIFLLYQAVLPAVAEVFLYVGGVLVLLLFTLMLLRRDVAGKPQLSSRHRPAAATTSLAVFAVLVAGFVPMGAAVPGNAVPVAAIADTLLGPQLPVFELLAALLLVALVAAVALTADRGSVTEPGGAPAGEPPDGAAGAPPAQNAPPSGGSAEERSAS